VQTLTLAQRKRVHFLLVSMRRLVDVSSPHSSPFSS
jgi:hypothetical protein